MITYEDFLRLTQQIKNKIFLTIGRSILKAVNNAESTQKLQLSGLIGETITDIERFTEYGFESYPKTGAQVLSNFINGNRDQGIAVCVHDRRFRPDYLSEGEVVSYTFEDVEGSPFRLWMKNGRIFQVDCDKVIVNADTSATVNTVTAEINGTTKIDMNSPIINMNTDALNINKFTGGGPQPTATINADLEITGATTQTGATTTTGAVGITGTTTQTGNINVTGAIGASGNIIDGGSNTNHHSHP